MGNELVSSILSYALSVFMGAAVVAASVPLVHILQLESYQGKMYLKWLMKHIGSDFVPSFVAGAAGACAEGGLCAYRRNQSAYRPRMLLSCGYSIHSHACGDIFFL